MKQWTSSRSRENRRAKPYADALETAPAIRAALDKQYKARTFGSYKMERTPKETVQTFLFATRTGKKVRKEGARAEGP